MAETERCSSCTQRFLLFWRMTEKRCIIPIKRCIIAESATLTDKRWLFSLVEHFLRQKKPFFHYIFFRCLMQFLLKQTEKIAFTDKKMLGNFLYFRDSTKIFVCIFESLRDERGEGRGAFGERVVRETDVVKKLGYKMVEYFLEGVRVAFSGIKIQLAKKLLKYILSQV